MRTHHEKEIKQVGYIYTNTDAEMTNKTRKLKNNSKTILNLQIFISLKIN